MQLSTDAYTDAVRGLLSTVSTSFSSDERLGELARKLPLLDTSPFRIGLAGPFNAGKTMLIGAFLQLPKEQLDELTAATPKTGEVTPYEWREHILLDLPGTLSGLDDHDAEAQAGVRRADLLLIVTTVELPGEAETDQINRLLSTEGFANRALVVINKANTEESERDVVESEMEARIADFPYIEIYFTDALEYLQSLNFPGLNQEDRELLREGSGIGELETALLSFAVDAGPLARLHATTHELRRVCDEAVRRWDPDNDEESLEVAADRIRLAFANARAELTDTTELAIETLRNELTSAGTTLAAAVSEEDGSVSKEAAATADAHEERAADEYEALIAKGIAAVQSKLEEQLGASSREWERYAASTTRADAGAFGKPLSADKSDGDELIDRLVDAGVSGVRRKLDGILKGGVRPGSQAHDLGKKLNDLLGRTAKPHDHVKMAKNITKVGKGASTAIGFLAPMADLKGIIDNVRRGEKIKAQRDNIRSAYEEHAAAVTKAERERLDAHIDDLLAPLHEAVLETLAAADEASEARREAQARFTALRQEASALAARIDEAFEAARS
jgi:hypothetical protein